MVLGGTVASRASYTEAFDLRAAVSGLYFLRSEHCGRRRPRLVSDLRCKDAGKYRRTAPLAGVDAKFAGAEDD